MKHAICILILSFITVMSYAQEPSNIDIETQKNAQERCIEQRLPQCDEKMCGDEDENCSETCKENIRNECRYAGE